MKLSREIKRNSLMEQLRGYELAIFPNLEPNQRGALADAAAAQLRHLDNLPDTPASLDRSSLQALKGRLQESRVIAVK